MAKMLRYQRSKTRLPELVAGVQEREEEVIVTKNGRPAAILINVNEYARLKVNLDGLSDPGLVSQIAESRAFYKPKHNGLSFEDVFGEPLAFVKKQCSAGPSSARTFLRMWQTSSVRSIRISNN